MGAGGEMAVRSQAARAARMAQALEDVKAGLVIDGPNTDEGEVRATSTELACGILAPYGTEMQWQTQWDTTANIQEGASVNAYSTVIGYAGNSDGGAGYNWAPHLHSRVTRNESYTAAGVPYGGVAVKPRAFRCYSCTDFDERTADGRKWYTVFYQNRWMRD